MEVRLSALQCCACLCHWEHIIIYRDQSQSSRWLPCSLQEQLWAALKQSLAIAEHGDPESSDAGLRAIFGPLLAPGAFSLPALSSALEGFGRSTAPAALRSMTARQLLEAVVQVTFRPDTSPESLYAASACCMLSCNAQVKKTNGNQK